MKVISFRTLCKNCLYRNLTYDYPTCEHYEKKNSKISSKDCPVWGRLRDEKDIIREFLEDRGFNYYELL